PITIAIARAAPNLIGYALGFDNRFLPEITSTTTDAMMKGTRRFPIQNEVLNDRLNIGTLLKLSREQPKLAAFVCASSDLKRRAAGPFVSGPKPVSTFFHSANSRARMGQCEPHRASFRNSSRSQRIPRVDCRGQPVLCMLDD